ncbi:hypothetical protein HPB47_018540 [Ixodes persulcatus]|uniref:Uncharacterized protein n=1 Tax=Ixodes persulcatus TaxID=34615 RepID=A0AC60QKG2_IXOPE|nr:hypothetical protein HPB47_018540 [Ixodes persulcatus]
MPPSALTRSSSSAGLRTTVLNCDHTDPVHCVQFNPKYVMLVAACWTIWATTWPGGGFSKRRLATQYDKQRPSWLETSGICKNCNYKEDLVHLMWSCPLYNLPRQRALDLITNAPVPASLNAWACPDTTISPKHALELWEALLTFIRDPTAPPVGDRLLPATAKRIRPPPPSSTKALKP